MDDEEISWRNTEGSYIRFRDHGARELSILPVQPLKYEIEPYNFKFGYFFEFFYLYLMAYFLGPLMKFILAKKAQSSPFLFHNLYVNDFKITNPKNLMWALRLFCIFTTFTLNSSNISQFWMLIYTEISICVLFAAYHCSFSEHQIQKFKTEFVDDGKDIFSRVKNIVRQGRSAFFERGNLNQAFPEIDADNFYLIYPNDFRDKIPPELKPESIADSPEFKDYFLPIKDGLVISAEKYALYIADQCGMKEIDTNLRVINGFSKFFVMIRMLIPIMVSLWHYVYCGYHLQPESDSEYTTQQITDFCNKYVDFGNPLAVYTYLIQQIGYFILLYRFTAVYNIILLGILLYYKKLHLLLRLSEAAKLRSDFANIFKVSMVVPQNIQNWFNIRRIFSESNRQLFVIVDTNMSFVLLFIIFFVFLVLVVSLGLVNSIPGLKNISQVFTDNGELLSSTIFYMFTLVIVLFIDMGLVVYLNLLYSWDLGEFNYHLGIMQTLTVNSRFYIKKKLDVSDGTSGDLFRRNVAEIKDLLGDEFEQHFYKYSKKLRDSLRMVVENLSFEQTFRPSTLLGLRVDLRLILSMFTAASALGLSSINKIAAAFTSFNGNSSNSTLIETLVP